MRFFHLALVILSVSATAFAGSCYDFEEAACELSENNIVGHDRFTNTAAECQVKCQNEATCTWFTHFDTQCYLLTECGTPALCGSCVSGPTSPDFSTCPWPPGPVPSSTTSTIHPTQPTTTKTTTTTTKTTSTTTKAPTTTTSGSGSCDEIKINEICDWDFGLIHWYENVMTGPECQHICGNVNGANFFSHYNEGREAEHGYCGCFSTCAWPSSDGCSNRCSTHEVFSEEDWEDEDINAEPLESSETFGGELGVEVSKAPRPGPRYCHCMRGPLEPDVDTCNLWP